MGADIYMRILLDTTGSSMVISAIRSMGGAFSLIGHTIGSIANNWGLFTTTGQAGIDAMKASASNLALGFAELGIAAAAVFGVIAIAIGVKAVKAASDFQQAMLSNVAHAGLAKAEFDKVSASVLRMSTEVGRSPTALAEALYPILSAFSGIQNQSAKSALALDTLRMSFQTVAGTTVDGTAVANAAVGTFNALGLATDNVSVNTGRMTNLFDVMDKTVQDGNMQWDTYKNVISKLAVSIQGTTVSFNEASAALATLTNLGFSAQKAQTYLSNMFTTMVIKTDLLAKHAKKLGIAFDEQKYSSMDLAGKIAYLNQVTGGNKQEILALLGNNATALKAFNALSTGMHIYNNTLTDLKHAHGALASSFATAAQGLGFQWDRVKAASEAVLITIGTQLLPVITKLAAQVVPVITQFANWIMKSHILETAIKNVKPLFDAFMGALRTLLPPVIQGFLLFLGLIQRIVTWAVQNKDVMNALKVIMVVIAGILVGVLAVGLFLVALGMTALGLAIGIVVGIVTLVVMVFTHWGQIVQWLKDRIGQFGAWIGGVIQAAIHKVVQFFQNGWNSIVHGFEWLYHHNYYFQMLVDKIHQIISAAVAWLSGIWDWIVKQISQKWEQLKGFAEKAWQNVSSVFSSVWSRYISGPLGNLWNRFTGWMTQLATNAFTWGVNLIQGFINGIKSMAGKVGQAAQDIVNNVKNFLGFHSPAKMGEGQHIVEWGSGMVHGFMQGMRAAQPQLQTALNLMFVPPGSHSAAPARAGRSGAVHNYHFEVSLATMARSQSEVRRLVDMLEAEIGSRVRTQTPGYSSGNVF
ncbi:MAG: phage tail tape measure protein [Ktedonobacteraceae bacterium]|nr:phage tail tape measure protein [Ktedonobacteraceae bacterium]